MSHLPNRYGMELGRVVFAPQLGGGEKDAKHLRVGTRRPLSYEEEQKKDQSAAHQTSEQIERRRPETHREEKQLSLRSEDRQRPGE
jgi:hypothetical protein